ncbi:MAG: hypothetical protein MJB14_18510 [Spirochaetes bacterium]|nr:hypothetical protein [Spirochaetota bacterium]
MPNIKPKSTMPPSSQWNLYYGEAIGSSSDFHVIAYCPELDEFEKNRNINHNEYSYIFHFDQRQRQQVTRLNRRLNALWEDPSGSVMAAGDTAGYLEISTQGVREVSLDNVAGQFYHFFGLGHHHLYGCGGYDSFFLCRRNGHWAAIDLPEECPVLWSIAGFHEHEIYLAGDNGTILFFDGEAVQRLESPTDHRLTTIAVLNDQHLCIGGYGGTLLIGNRHRWRVVTTNSNAPLLKIVEFAGKLYYGTKDALWSFDGQDSPVKELDMEVRWISKLDDGLLLANGSAYLYVDNTLTPIDNKLDDQPVL